MGARTAELLRLGASPLSSPAALGEFASGGSWKRHPHLQLINEYLLKVAAGRIKRLAISMPPQHGKQCAHDTPVLTTKGWTTHGELRPGDSVFGTCGPVRVVAISEESLATIEVEFTDGSKIRCHENHEWRVYDRAGGSWRNVSTAYLRAQKHWSGDRARFGVESPRVEGERRALPVEPYTLGAWLGDGSTGKPCITHAPRDSAVVEEIARHYPRGATWTHKTTGCLTTTFGEGRPGKRGRLTRDLTEAGVLTAKHIPDIYFVASLDQRRELLAGLMDTDGFVHHRSRRAVFSSCSERLADDVAVLVRTFGWRATKARFEPRTSTSGIVGTQVVYQVSFSPSGPIPCRLQRKRVEGFKVAARRRGIRAIRECAPAAGRCIQVDATDGIYLVGRGLVPTHNSELISHYFPAWYLLHWPQQKIILASYEAAFARMWGRKARDLVERYGTELAGVMVRRDSKAANLWLLEAGGYMATAGARGPISGKAGNGVILDDTLKDAKEAQSKIIKDAQEDWLDSVVKTRLAKEGWLIIVGTRWAKDDLIGRVTAKNARGSDEWEVLNLPAIAEKRESYGMSWTRAVGDPLCEELHPLKELLKAKASMRAYWWSAVYMGRPTVKGGKFFKRGWWKWAEPDDVPKLSRFARLVRYWDKAATEEGEGDDPDFTVGALIGELEIPVEGQPGEFDTEYWVLDVVRDQLSSAGVRKLMRSTAERDGEEVMIRVEQEPGSSGKDVAFEFYDVFAGFPYKPERVTGSKSLRAESFAGAVENGKVRLVKAAWNEAWLEEFDDFPNGGHDDQVDAGSGAYRTIHRPGPTVDYVS